MYRSRLGGGDPDARILGYLSSAGADSEILKYDIVGSQAHVLMLAKIGLLTDNVAGRILSALQELADGSRNLPVAGPAEDIHELIETTIIEMTGMEYGGRMHAARSRNDQVALDTRMKVRDDINVICGYLLDTASVMTNLACDHTNTVMPLYTHMQQAQAGLFSHWLLAHAAALLRDFERLYGTFNRVNKSPLGAGPVGGTSIPVDREYVAELLGFDGLVYNSLDATSTRDFAIEYVAAVSIMMSNLSRLSEDLIVWSTSEFSFVELSDNLASPSSAMPQKKNPDVLELTRARTAESAGHLTAILGMVKGLASGYGRDLQQVKPAVWSATDTAISALLAIQSIFGGIRVNKTRMYEAAAASDLVALDIAERLVQECNVPFRAAHGIAGRLVQHAHKFNKRVRELTPTEIKDAVSLDGNDDGSDNSDNKASIDLQILHGVVTTSDIKSSLQHRVSKGSSGFAEQERMISDTNILIGTYRSNLADRINKIQNALHSMTAQISTIVG